ncbi:MAG: bifunctional folylpolyglutamate synthase/dihydrofolate synthase [Gammaproteobacteria bacterium]|nr:bifunctional folylpolyglutamate synthase/dihydrofolate synthase [Gammaproteobacteria bacterium]NNC96949.1 bifunctional folylpolyglutamate synthase/dihydrofolate synthase [Gammaproteobacteria bacterium]NNM14581.1 bifunctional folylpolyglutamate synthase/dihydrofolate synthase [Gammaproteobacteria bacterium]
MGDPNNSQQPEDWLNLNSSSVDHIDLGTRRCRQVLQKLGLSKPPYEIFTVAGTNGKGSSVAMLDSILTGADYLTGRYTSPHLQQFNERISIAQNNSSDDHIVAAFNKIQTAANQVQPTGIKLTYFEYATLAALLLFAEAQVDVAILEVGLGGRLDAVNAVDADVSIITSIALDHQNWLGHDIASIAFEKAGVMRPDKPCILAESNMPDTLHAYALSIGAILIENGKDYLFSVVSGEQGNSWTWSDKTGTFKYALPALSGAIQIQNAAAVISAIRASDFIKISENNINHGLQHVRLTGRCQVKEVLNKTWILDVAHNPAALKQLTQNLESIAAPQKVNIIFGMLEDKNAQACIEILKPYVSNWIFVDLASSRARPASELAQIATECNIEKEYINVFASVNEACDQAQEHALRHILVCGSFYTVAAALDCLATA